jgi:hypothetical protein
MIKPRIVQDRLYKGIKIMLLRPTERQMQRGFKPYALELGMLIFSWNRLQAALGQLFSDVLTGTKFNISQAAWNAITIDRLQRQMLLAAAIASPSLQARAKDDIKWIVDRAEEFEDRRNNAIHAPFEFVLEKDFRGYVLAPAWYTGHPRAIKLRDKHLLNEFRWYGETAAVLANFARRVHYRFDDSGSSWPRRPELPQLGQSATRRGRPRRTKPKSPPPPPE